jgi:anti-sigma B factor antagonist
MKVTFLETGHFVPVTILALTGDFDSFVLPDVERKIRDLVEDGTTRLVLNLSQLNFINSSALSFVIRLLKQFEEAGGGLAVGPPGQFFASAIETLGLTGENGIFAGKIFPTEEKAITALANAAV